MAWPLAAHAQAPAKLYRIFWVSTGECLLIGVDRKSSAHPQNDLIGPKSDIGERSDRR